MIASVLLAMFVLLRIRGITVADERLEDYALAIRKVMWVALAAGVLMAAIVALKTLYFGDWLPQPVAAKLGGHVLLSSPRWTMGLSTSHRR